MSKWSTGRSLSNNDIFGNNNIISPLKETHSNEPLNSKPSPKPGESSSSSFLDRRNSNSASYSVQNFRKPRLFGAVSPLVSPKPSNPKIEIKTIRPTLISPENISSSKPTSPNNPGKKKLFQRLRESSQPKDGTPPHQQDTKTVVMEHDEIVDKNKKSIKKKQIPTKHAEEDDPKQEDEVENDDEDSLHENDREDEINPKNGVLKKNKNFTDDGFTYSHSADACKKHKSKSKQKDKQRFKFFPDSDSEIEEEKSTSSKIRKKEIEEILEEEEKSDNDDEDMSEFLANSRKRKRENPENPEKRTTKRKRSSPKEEIEEEEEEIEEEEIEEKQNPQKQKQRNGASSSSSEEQEEKGNDIGTKTYIEPESTQISVKSVTNWWFVLFFCENVTKICVGGTIDKMDEEVNQTSQSQRRNSGLKQCSDGKTLWVSTPIISCHNPPYRKLFYTMNSLYILDGPCDFGKMLKENKCFPSANEKFWEDFKIGLPFNWKEKISEISKNIKTNPRSSKKKAIDNPLAQLLDHENESDNDEIAFNEPAEHYEIKPPENVKGYETSYEVEKNISQSLTKQLKDQNISSDSYDSSQNTNHGIEAKISQEIEKFVLESVQKTYYQMEEKLKQEMKKMIVAVSPSPSAIQIQQTIPSNPAISSISNQKQEQHQSAHFNLDFGTPQASPQQNIVEKRDSIIPILDLNVDNAKTPLLNASSSINADEEISEEGIFSETEILDKENEKQQEIEMEKQQEMEKQKQQEIEKQRQQEIEKQRRQEMEIQRQQEIEKQKQQEMEKQKQQEIEKQKQQEIEKQKQQEIEKKKQQEIEKQKQKELEIAKQKEKERQIAIQTEKENQIEQEKEKQKQKELEIAKQKQIEKEKELEIAKQKQIEKEREKEHEIAKQKQLQLDLEIEKAKQKQKELEKHHHPEIGKEKGKGIEKIPSNTPTPAKSLQESKENEQKRNQTLHHPASNIALEEEEDNDVAPDFGDTFEEGQNNLQNNNNDMQTNFEMDEKSLLEEKAKYDAELDRPQREKENEKEKENKPNRKKRNREEAGMENNLTPSPQNNKKLRKSTPKPSNDEKKIAPDQEFVIDDSTLDDLLGDSRPSVGDDIWELFENTEENGIPSTSVAPAPPVAPASKRKMSKSPRKKK